MAWFDGTFEWNNSVLECKYPNRITDSIRFSYDGKKLAIINDFEEGSALYHLSDPMLELGTAHATEHVFYHVIKGKEAHAVKRAFRCFCDRWNKENYAQILLFRRDEKNLYSYGNGFICVDKMRDQSKLATELLGTDTDKEPCFIIPLKLFLHKCPVCGHRTLQYRDMYEICTECGWEDGGGEDDELLGITCMYTLSAYRKAYLKCKAENPSLTWENSELMRRKLDIKSCRNPWGIVEPRESYNPY